jgi:hypothetical protein
MDNSGAVMARKWPWLDFCSRQNTSRIRRGVPVKNIATITLFVAVVVFVLGDIATRDFA